LKARRAKTGVELRDGQSFALAGLLDNSESTTLSKVPGVGDIPILGNLFRSKQFQKNESELMFIVTAQVVKPVNRDDLPAIPNVENLKNGSLLGVEPKGAGLVGPSGFMTTPGASAAPSTDQAKPATPSGSGGSVVTNGAPAAVSPTKTPNP